MNQLTCSPVLKRMLTGCVTVSLFLAGLPESPASSSGALINYVTAADDSYAFKELERRNLQQVTAVRLEMTSQTWRGHVWKHEILLVRPEAPRNDDTAFLLVSGDGDVEKQFGLLRTLAVRAGAVAAVVNRVPNQPLYDGREEDALIAYTFDQFLRTGDPSWPLLFPMVKSAAKAMDTIRAFAREQWDQKISRFAVGGASKRGWTSWLTAAADSRVEAIAPMVIDMLNMKEQTQWAKKMYGRQSEQIEDYTQYDLTERMDEPRMVQLREWVDPYSYREEYRMPKLLLLGTNDPYWVVDSLRHYWGQLPQPKLVYQTPNAGHDLGGGDATQTLAAFFQMVADEEPLPRMTWKWSTNDFGSELRVKLDRPAAAFRLWTATSTDRDFRDEKWSSQSLANDGATNVVAMIEPPPSGFRAALIEAQLVSPTGQHYRLSTEARVTPDGPPVK